MAPEKTRSTGHGNEAVGVFRIVCLVVGIGHHHSSVIIGGTIGQLQDECHSLRLSPSPAAPLSEMQSGGLAGPGSVGRAPGL